MIPLYSYGDSRWRNEWDSGSSKAVTQRLKSVRPDDALKLKNGHCWVRFECRKGQKERHTVAATWKFTFQLQLIALIGKAPGGLETKHPALFLLLFFPSSSFSYPSSFRLDNLTYVPACLPIVFVV